MVGNMDGVWDGGPILPPGCRELRRPALVSDAWAPDEVECDSLAFLVVGASDNRLSPLAGGLFRVAASDDAMISL